MSDPYIMYRYLSEEDRKAIVPDFLSDEYKINYIVYSDLDESIVPKLKTLLLDVPYVKSSINDIKGQLKKVKKDRKSKEKTLKNFRTTLIEHLYDEVKSKLKFKIKYYDCYYPIDNKNLSDRDVKINSYLRGKSWSGVRTTHGIHGLFNYKIADGKNIHKHYGAYGHWGYSKGGSTTRETGGRGIGAKCLFVTTYKSNENNGELVGGSFKNLFEELDTNTKTEPEFISCDGGEGAEPMGDDLGNIAEDIGELSTCPEFEGLLDGIKYARLGKLMSGDSRRPEEINFKGVGKIRGYFIDMNDYDIEFDHNKSDELLKILSFLKHKIKDTIDNWSKEKMKEGSSHIKLFDGIQKNLLNRFETKELLNLDISEMEIDQGGGNKKTKKRQKGGRSSKKNKRSKRIKRK